MRRLHEGDRREDEGVWESMESRDDSERVMVGVGGVEVSL